VENEVRPLCSLQGVMGYSKQRQGIEKRLVGGIFNLPRQEEVEQA
jgi:hypothetical protein